MVLKSRGSETQGGKRGCTVRTDLLPPEDISCVGWGRRKIQLLALVLVYYNNSRKVWGFSMESKKERKNDSNGLGSASSPSSPSAKYERDREGWRFRLPGRWCGGIKTNRFEVGQPLRRKLEKGTYLRRCLFHGYWWNWCAKRKKRILPRESPIFWLFIRTFAKKFICATLGLDGRIDKYYKVFKCTVCHAVT